MFHVSKVIGVHNVLFIENIWLFFCRQKYKSSRYSTRNDETTIVNYDVERKRNLQGEWTKKREREQTEGMEERERFWVSMKGKLEPLQRNSNRTVRTILFGEGVTRSIIRWKRSLSYHPPSSNGEEHCFTTNGLAPVNHWIQCAPVRLRFTRVQLRAAEFRAV